MARVKADVSDKKSGRVKKDPNAPKRNQSAYFLWLNANRGRLNQDNPTLKMTEISKVAGREWSELKDKSKWEQLAAEEKQLYQKAKAAYEATKTAA